jgi:hypothetical protein
LKCGRFENNRANYTAFEVGEFGTVAPVKVDYVVAELEGDTKTFAKMAGASDGVFR